MDTGVLEIDWSNMMREPPLKIFIFGLAYPAFGEGATMLDSPWTSLELLAAVQEVTLVGKDSVYGILWKKLVVDHTEMAIWIGNSCAKLQSWIAGSSMAVWYPPTLLWKVIVGSGPSFMLTEFGEICEGDEAARICWYAIRDCCKLEKCVQ